ncbi:MAG: hypothetical protein IJN29_00405 [Akkermansia sp.]|nr:hypothetical protein [Akkermansia sp.]
MPELYLRARGALRGIRSVPDGAGLLLFRDADCDRSFFSSSFFPTPNFFCLVGMLTALPPIFTRKVMPPSFCRALSPPSKQLSLFPEFASEISQMNSFLRYKMPFLLISAFLTPKLNF